MSWIGIWILSTAIIITPNHKSNGGEKEDALKMAAKAAYKQTNLDDKVKKLEKKYISKPVRYYGGIIIQTTKIIKEKRVSYEWEF